MNRDWVSYAILILGALFIAFAAADIFGPAYGAPGDECNGYETTACTSVVWVLTVGEDDIAEFETQEQCVEWAAKVDEQTPPFTPIQCHAEWVARTDL
jgi:hypothetical protein